MIQNESEKKSNRAHNGPEEVQDQHFANCILSLNKETGSISRPLLGPDKSCMFYCFRQDNKDEVFEI